MATGWLLSCSLIILRSQSWISWYDSLVEKCFLYDMQLFFSLINHDFSGLQEASFDGGKMKFSKYMDNFPFPYYIVLRNIEALPRTLANLLRQVSFGSLPLSEAEKRSEKDIPCYQK